MFSFVTYFCRYVPVVKNTRIKKDNALVIRTYFDVTQIAIQRIAKHLNYMCLHYNLSTNLSDFGVFFSYGLVLSFHCFVWSIKSIF